MVGPNVGPMDPEAFDAPLREQLEIFVDEHRADLYDSLDGLTEEEARRQLVPSRTTLLGLVKHAIFVEKVWHAETIERRSRAETRRLPAMPDDTFVLD